MPHLVSQAFNSIATRTPGRGERISRTDGLLEDWAMLSEIDQRSSIAMTEEVKACSSLIEDAALDLSARFRTLASAADAQTARVARIAEIARMVEVGDQSMSLADATRIVQQVLAEAIDGLSAAAEQARRMGAALAGVTQEFAGVEACIARIDDINRQAKFVAINAMIEAQRAEGESGPFRVIAHELKELAKDTDATSRTVRDRVARAASGVGVARAELGAIAANDQAALGGRRARLDGIIAAMVAQNGLLAGIAEEASEAARDIDAAVAGLVTGTQFQDRASQHLAQVVETLALLAEAKGSLQADTVAGLPAPLQVSADHPLVRRILGSHSLSAVRQRFLLRMVEGAPQDAPAAPPPANDIELF
jgi:methyl-accepting chemotaxis protein